MLQHDRDRAYEHRARHEDDDEDLGGDPVCWLSRVCPECGAIADSEPPTVCPRCDTEIPAD